MFRILSFLLTTLTILAGLTLLFTIDTVRISNDSMEPNYAGGSYYFLDRLTGYFSTPSRHDVVLATYEESPDNRVVSRIIGLPGDKILINDGAVIINDEIVQEDYVLGATYTNVGYEETIDFDADKIELVEKRTQTFLLPGIEITIPEGKYFLMGDNREKSTDSRQLGLVSENDIVGKLMVKYWPL